MKNQLSCSETLKYDVSKQTIPVFASRRQQGTQRFIRHKGGKTRFGTYKSLFHVTKTIKRLKKTFRFNS